MADILESVLGDFSDDPNSPESLVLEEGANTLEASSAGGDQEYVTVTVPEGFQLDSIELESLSSGGDLAFIAVQEGTVFTEPLDNTADTSELLGYFLFNAGSVGSDILGNIGNGAGAIGFTGPLPSGDYTFALQQLDGPSEYELIFNTSAVGVGLPSVSITTTTPVVTEDGQPPEFDLVFTVDGPIPDDGQGVVVTLGGDLLELFGNQDLLDPGFGLVTDPADGIVPIENRGSEVDFGLTAETVSVTLALFDDIIQEEPLTLEFEVLEGDGYDVDQAVASITIEDGDIPDQSTVPEVSLSVSDTDLMEGDELTVFFNVEESNGAIPEDGLQVFVSSGPTDIGEFVIFGEGGIDPDTDLVGIDEFPLQGDDRGGFFVTLVEPQASITLSVFDDGPTEGPEDLTFELQDGEQYEVDPDGEEVILTIDDGGAGAGVVFNLEGGTTSIYIDTDLLEEATGLTIPEIVSEGTPADRPGFLPPFQVGFPIVEATDFSFAPVPFTPLGGTIEHEGTLTLTLGNLGQIPVGDFSIGFDPDRVSDINSGFFVADTLEDPLNLEILFDLGIPQNAVVSGSEVDLGDFDLLLAPELAGALTLRS
ncbi:hypothetical protein [Crocosphaera sp. Alani8]|uniref:hypothetical protein n=1 Tax=Crocosphaera sp. Alani8 TaxID=3038952 RepID=UPI00313DEED3